MMGIVDCKHMDMSSIIEACSVEQDSGEVAQHLSGAWTTNVNRTAARLERQLLMTLLAAGSVTTNAKEVMKYSLGSAVATVDDDAAQLRLEGPLSSRPEELLTEVMRKVGELLQEDLRPQKNDRKLEMGQWRMSMDVLVPLALHSEALVAGTFRRPG
jgi:hypothetical protein